MVYRIWESFVPTDQEQAHNKPMCPANSGNLSDCVLLFFSDWFRSKTRDHILFYLNSNGMSFNWWALSILWINRRFIKHIMIPPVCLKRAKVHFSIANRWIAYAAYVGDIFNVIILYILIIMFNLWMMFNVREYLVFWQMMMIFCTSTHQTFWSGAIAIYD